MLVPVLGLLAPALVPYHPLPAPGNGESRPARTASALAFGDVDQDGLDDALLLGPSGELTLLANRGQGRFEDVTHQSGLTALDFATCALFADLDGDGRLDLFLGSSAQRLWRNLGQGAFEPLDAGLDHDLVDLAALATDLDRDGRLDLHLHTEAGVVLYRNDGAGRFERVELPGATQPAATALPASGPSTLEPSGGAHVSPAASREDRARQRQLRWLRLRDARGADERGIDAPDGGASLDPSLLGPMGGDHTPLGPSEHAPDPLLICAATVHDQATSQCIGASSVPALGKLYPLSNDLFVDAATGNVGIGTLTPLYALHVDGKLVSGLGTSATGNNAAVGGGASNTASGAHATVAGGESNTAGTSHAFVGGGLSNTTTGTRAVIGGGISNTAGNSSVVGGGSNNDANFNFSTVAGGRLNTADAPYAMVGGGASNTASGLYSFVGGGGEDGVPASGNTASGLAAAVPGGRANVAAGASSLAAGQRAKALHDGTFVWADSQAADFASTGVDQFAIRAGGGVGIGTAAPTAGLHLQSDRGFLATGSLGAGTIPVEGAGTRMMFYPGKAAFRVGRALSSEWDDTNVGYDSIAMGLATRASGESSIAMGHATEASGSNGTATGFGTLASGAYSTATGIATEAATFAGFAIGQYNVGGGSATTWVATDPLLEVGNGTATFSRANALTVLKNGHVGIGTAAPTAGLHLQSTQGLLATGTVGAGTIPVEGAGTRMMFYPGKAAFRVGRAVGSEWDDANVTDYSTAMGYGTLASGNTSTALGRDTVASGNSSTAMGSTSEASGSQSTAMGSSTVASGTYSTAMGRDTVASGIYGTAMGLETEASGSNSIAMGYRTVASGTLSTTMGLDTKAEGYASVAIGRYNIGGGSATWVATDPLLELGNGTSDLARANALTVLKNGSVGVGTATPGLRLQVEGGSDAAPGGGGYAQFGSTSGSNVVIDTNEIMARDNGGTRSLSLNADGGSVYVSENGTGNLGVGRTNTANRLEVEGNASKTTAGSWLANSDRRIKADVRTIEGALDTLERVRAVSFHYTDAYRAAHPSIEDKLYYNVIAQEFAEVFPDYVRSSGEGDILQVDTYPALIHALAAIRELRAEKDRENADLRAELDELRALVAELAARSGPGHHVELGSEGDSARGGMAAGRRARTGPGGAPPAEEARCHPGALAPIRGSPPGQ